MGLFLLSSASMAMPAMAQAPAAPEPPPPSYTVALTGYNAVPEQTDDTPFDTASGAYSNPQVVAARTADLADKLPFGTIIEIEGPATPDDYDCGYHAAAPHIGYRVIADAMNPRLKGRVDILFGTSTTVMNPVVGKKQNPANAIGICRGSTVRVVGWVDITKIPKTQAELAILVNGKTLAAK